MNEMQKWLKNYMNERHPKNPKQPNPGWQSSKYDLSMPWQDLQSQWLPEVRMNFGQAVSALKRSWKAYRIAGRNGGTAS
jgi:hypothetical protein